MNGVKLLLLYAVSLIAAMMISYFAFYQISTWRAQKKTKNIVLGILGLIVLAAGVWLTSRAVGAFIAYLLGAIVGFMPFFHVKNSETEAQFKATTREREKREKKYEEEKARRENKE